MTYDGIEGSKVLKIEDFLATMGMNHGDVKKMLNHNKRKDGRGRERI